MEFFYYNKKLTFKNLTESSWFVGHNCEIMKQIIFYYFPKRIYL